MVRPVETSRSGGGIQSKSDCERESLRAPGRYYTEHNQKPLPPHGPFHERILRCTALVAGVFYTVLGRRTGWFKHEPPNSFSCQCPHRFLELDPEISHTCLMCPCQAFNEWFYFVFVFIRQMFEFLYPVSYTHLTLPTTPYV